MEETVKARIKALQVQAEKRTKTGVGHPNVSTRKSDVKDPPPSKSKSDRQWELKKQQGKLDEVGLNEVFGGALLPF